MITGSVQIRDTATPFLLRARAAVKRPRALMAAAGKRVEVVHRAHFAAKNAQGNSRGWPRSHFWNRRVRQATAFTGATDTSAEVRIASPELMHKITGGTIRPKRGKYLAIPLTAQAKAAGSPREWDDPSALVAIRTGSGLFLMLKRGPKGRLLAMYKLVRSVTHKPDPTALPPEEEVSAAIDDETQKYLRRELAGGAR